MAKRYYVGICRRSGKTESVMRQMENVEAEVLR